MIEDIVLIIAVYSITLFALGVVESLFRSGSWIFRGALFVGMATVILGIVIEKGDVVDLETHSPADKKTAFLAYARTVAVASVEVLRRRVQPSLLNIVSATFDALFRWLA